METHEDRLIATLDETILQLGDAIAALEDLAAQRRAEQAGEKSVLDHLAELKNGDPEHDRLIDSLDTAQLDEKRRGHLLTSRPTGLKVFTNLFWTGGDE